MPQKIIRRPRCIAPLFLGAVLFSAPALGVTNNSVPTVLPAGTSAPAPAPAPTAGVPHAVPLFARDPLGKVMLAFGFLGLLLFTGGAGAAAPRSRRRFEVRCRHFPYGSFYERRRAERDLR